MTKEAKEYCFQSNSSKAVQTKEQSEEEESSEEMSDDEQALFNRKFKRMWIKQQKGKGTSRKDNKRDSSLKKKPFTHKSEGGSTLDKSNITCFECKKPGHIKPDCPKLAKKSGKKPFYKKKKALAAGWDESEDGSEDEDEGEDDDALFALMASAESSEDEDDDEVKPENLKEEFNELLEHSYTLSEKYKALKKQFAKLQLEHEKVLIEKNHVLKENIALKEQDSVKEVTSLKKIIKKLIDDLSIFTIGHDNLVKLCGNNRELYDRSGLGFDSESTSSSECMSDISFVSSEIDQNKFVVNYNVGKFDNKSDQGILLGYSTHSKAYRVFNSRTKAVEESINVMFDDHSIDSTDRLEKDFLNLDLFDPKDDGISKEAQPSDNSPTVQSTVSPLETQEQSD
ncbi:uncharacterized protein LOC130725165 [Lotus japonicus]|uniref:uncharacterized protein LOC130725165 n=1 Tax=Lotus japonicus TaxID=34305 RepID=UPI00258A7383|nr:uncharacterized protein LOC130725165 [Lotus japonicus]